MMIRTAFCALLALAAAGMLHLAAWPAAASEKAPSMRQSLPNQETIAALPADGGEEFNRLVFEQSPYLLQHARNPVDWRPWGDEAFAAAKEADKPVFLSIGYSTCHWCHVMEHESFEDMQVAALLNDHFIPVKVDREERPDIDQLYMSVTQAMTGQGGWPMTVVLTPERKPFFAGTYFPKRARSGMPGMMELLPSLNHTWKNQREKVLESAEGITGHLQKMTSNKPGEALGHDEMNRAYEHFASNFDEEFGGFDWGRHKFPVPHNYRFLLRYAQRHDDAKALEMVEKTLTQMRLGGIFDHVGFGFHRYATDQEWLVPHFEKMLYDQALLAMLYVEAWQHTGRASYKRTANEILAYVRRDMTAPEGGFYTAEDADSEGEEGLFYVWEPQEIIDILGQEDGERWCRIFTIRNGGNFREESTGAYTGKSIPHLLKTPIELADDLKMSLEDFNAFVERCRQKLFEVREKRIHPLKDDKILTDWNGLMIAAYAMAGRAFGDQEHILTAAKAAAFVLSNLQDDRGRLLKRYRNGTASLHGVLDDYAFLVWGLIELHQATFEVAYLKEAVRLTELMVKHFGDAENGGFYLSADDGEALLVRSKESYDGAQPSGNSVAAYNLIRLSKLTGRTNFAEVADKTILAFSGAVSSMPSQYSQMMMAADLLVGPSHEVVLSAENRDDLKAMATALDQKFLPRRVTIARTARNAEELASVAGYTETQAPVDGKATAYVCQNHTCKAPTTDLDEVISALTEAK